MSKCRVKTYVIDIICAKCGTFIYKYRKEGPGSLVKCYVSSIIKNNTKNDLRCSGCEQEFARHATYHNRPAHKIIQGKVIVKGHCGK